MAKERPSWDEYFMYQAYWAATRSSCLHLNAGAAIVKDKRVIASGYNGAPPGIQNCLEVGCRKEKEGVPFEEKGKSVCRGIHAETNARGQKGREELKGTTLYSVYFPCGPCAKEIAGAGIVEVVYSKFYNDEKDLLAQEIFSQAGIKVRRLELDLKKCSNFIKNLK